MHLVLVILLTTVFYCVCGVPKTPASSLDQAWMDNFKAFKRIYGRTSDKEIYGSSFPTLANLEDQKRDASEKKERHHFKKEEFADRYSFDDSYKDLFNKKPYKKRKISNVAKPISQKSDPETYNYLKHLEELEQRLFSSRGGYKPFDEYSDESNEDLDDYTSIPEALDSHELNENTADRDRNYSRKKKRRKKQPSVGYSYGPRRKQCPTGRCTQKTKTIRVRTGPYIKDRKK